jgi:hypothetical protein
MLNQVTIKCNPELQKAVKAYCKANGIKLQHFTDEALKEKLESSGRKC